MPAVPLKIRGETRLFILAVYVASLSAFSCTAAASAALHFAQTISLPDVKGRFDHFAVDVKGRHLFVAALSNDTVEVLDPSNAKRLQSIHDLHKPTGVLYLPDSNRICVANGDDGTLKIFDGVSYKLISTLKSLDDADNLRLDSAHNTIYLGYGAGALAAIDATTFAQAATIKLQGHPESFQLEKNGARIFVNVPDAKHVAVVDGVKRTLVATWPLSSFQANFPMSLDESNRRLFIGCRKPSRLVVLDTQTGKAVTDVAISGDTDDMFYDAALKRIYISCGQGFIDIIDQHDSDSYQLRARIATRGGAQTSFFSPDLGTFYLAVPEEGGKPAEIRIFQVVK